MNIVKDKNTWNSLLKGEFEQYNDIYFRYEYFELYRKYYNVDPEVVFWEDNRVRVFLAHLVRDISKIGQFKDFKYYDLTTPYGYGGPLVIVKKGKEKINKSLKEFFEEYRNYALTNSYICEFIRFHPIFENWKSLNGVFDIEHTNDVVIIDLTKDLEEIWKDIKRGHRYNIKKSTREGCKVEIASNASKKIGNFIKVYYLTMDKNKAPKKYYFSTEFINSHLSLLNALLVEVKYKNEVIGASIFIYGDKIVHYHLSGATHGFRGLYPSDLTLWEATKWAKENDFKYLHLGGGRGKNDSLFEFKRGFSKITLPFYIGKRIFNMKVYQKLLNLNSSSNGYFPAYRQGFNEKIV